MESRKRMATKRKSSTPEAPPVRLFTVLVDRMSYYGGSMEWSLPTKNDDGTWIPGEWMEVTGDLILCQNGLHLTREPYTWFVEGAMVFAAEHDGEIISDGSNTVAVRRARLLAEAVWSDHGVFHEGEHALSSNATARLYDNATARLSGNATVVSDEWHSYSAKVALSQMAVHVDRRGGRIVVRMAQDEVRP